jgi:hypothetical protein
VGAVGEESISVEELEEALKYGLVSDAALDDD